MHISNKSYIKTNFPHYIFKENYQNKINVFVSLQSKLYIVIYRVNK